MRTAHLAPQHHPFGGGYTQGVSNGQGGDTASRYAPRAQAGTENKPIATGKLIEQLTAFGPFCEIAEIFCLHPSLKALISSTVT